MLSARGKLECVVLQGLITIKGVTTLINNSPYLILLHIHTTVPPFNDLEGWLGTDKYDPLTATHIAMEDLSPQNIIYKLNR